MSSSNSRRTRPPTAGPPLLAGHPAAVVHAHYTDQLFGARCEDGPARLARLVAPGRRLVVTLHDVPTGDGSERDVRRAAAYREVAALADALIVCSAPRARPAARRRHHRARRGHPPLVGAAAARCARPAPPGGRPSACSASCSRARAIATSSTPPPRLGARHRGVGPRCRQRRPRRAGRRADGPCRPPSGCRSGSPGSSPTTRWRRPWPRSRCGGAPHPGVGVGVDQHVDRRPPPTPRPGQRLQPRAGGRRAAAPSASTTRTDGDGLAGAIEIALADPARHVDRRASRPPVARGRRRPPCRPLPPARRPPRERIPPSKPVAVAGGLAVPATAGTSWPTPSPPRATVPSPRSP